MLVLLIVFMVTAPLLTVGVPVDLPQTRAQNIPTKEEPLPGHHRRRRHRSIVQEKQVATEDLVPMLTAIAKAQASAAGGGRTRPGSSCAATRRWPMAGSWR